VLYAHPAVHEAAAVGLPDDYWGESLHAYVVVRAGAEASDEELSAWCEERLARFKLPKAFHRLEALPRNAAGKVLKRDLKERAKEIA
jgi:acyl-CoA synthetase (AMP-forming)/AMP-acid ligase II